jgi:hypothetical protein
MFNGAVEHLYCICVLGFRCRGERMRAGLRYQGVEEERNLKVNWLVRRRTAD